MPEIEMGSCAMFKTWGNFITMPKASFISRLKKGYQRVNTDPPSDRQIRAWENCYEVLSEIGKQLTTDFLNLWLVFEYALPNHKPGTRRFAGEKHLRADTIVIGRDTVLVLEFKMVSDPYFGYFKQTKKYQTRLERFHVESRNMEIKSLLVLTKATGYKGEKADVPGCSPDELLEEVKRLMGDCPVRHYDIRKWVHSSFHE